MTVTSRRTVLGAGGLLVCGAVVWGAKDLMMDVDPAPLNLSNDRVALAGYDPVAYFTDGAPKEGEADITVEHGGAVYRFASTEHRDLFAADPQKYTPAYGGYCSYGVRLGMKFDIDPAAFEVVNGRLYVQLDPGTRSVWLQERDENIRIADEIWKSIQPVPPASLPLHESG